MEITEPWPWALEPAVSAVVFQVPDTSAHLQAKLHALSFVLDLWHILYQHISWAINVVWLSGKLKMISFLRQLILEKEELDADDPIMRALRNERVTGIGVQNKPLFISPVVSEVNPQCFCL